MDRLRRFALHLLQKTSSSLKRGIIEKSSTELIHCLCDCSYNILKGNVKIASSNKRKLSKHKTKLQKLSNKKVSLKKKRKILQTGGFLSVLLNALAPVLGGVLGTLTQ